MYSDEQFEEVALADDGLVANLGDDALLVSHTTGSPATIQRIAAAGNGHVVDAPFSGGADNVLAGTLTVMIGGAPDDVERVRARPSPRTRIRSSRSARWGARSR